MLTLGVIAVVAFLIAALAWPSASVNPTSVGGFGSQTFAAARGPSGSVLPPGNWELIDSIGLGLWNSTTLAVNYSGVPANCTLTLEGNPPPTQLSIPSFRGNLTSGEAALWLFTYFDPGTGTEASVIDAGSPLLFATLGGPNCISLPPTVMGIPDSVVDSSVAAKALVGSGLASFLSTNPSGISVLMTIGPTFSNLSLTTNWDFEFTPCSGILTGNFSGPANASAFTGAVNATTGSVESAVLGPAGCQGPSPTVPLGSVFGVANPVLTIGAGTNASLPSQGCTSGDYCYQISIVVSSNGVTPSDLGLEVLNSNGQANGSVTGYAITNAAGQVIVYSLGPVEYAWAPGLANASTPLSPVDTIWIDLGTTNPSGQGLTFQIVGTGPYSGTIGLQLP